MEIANASRKIKKQYEITQYCLPPANAAEPLAFKWRRCIFQLMYLKQDNHQQREVGYTFHWALQWLFYSLAGEKRNRLSDGIIFTVHMLCKNVFIFQNVGFNYGPLLFVEPSFNGLGRTQQTPDLIGQKLCPVHSKRNLVRKLLKSVRSTAVICWRRGTIYRERGISGLCCYCHTYTVQSRAG